MLNAFIISFKLRSAYKKNGIIYSLKSLPVIKKLLPQALYSSRGLGIFAVIISVISELFSAFAGKALYLFAVYMAATYFKADTANSYAHIIVFAGLIGGFFNMHLFGASRDKYYAMFIMRLNARAYTLSNYIYFLIKQFTGLLIFSLIFGALCGANVSVCIAVSVYTVCVKLYFSAWSLKLYKSKDKLINENNPTKYHWIGLGVLLVLALLPPYLGYSISGEVLLISAAALILPAAFASKYALCFDEYRAIYKQILKPENIIILTSTRQAVADAQKQAMNKKITIDTHQTSDKSGYKYFNELFMKRHFKLLTRSAKRITVFCAAAFAAAAAACYISVEVKTAVNEIMLTFLPYFLFVMYIINRGKVITQAMFMNCDHSMLTYRFYRQPKAVLLLFAQRLKYIIAINLAPALVIAAGLPVLLYITGGTSEPVNYLLLFVSIIAMSVFFSVHHIVLYYLLQPYNINLESKSAAYSIANFVTYLLCYIAIGRKIPTVIFGTAITVFCVLYAAVALLMAYHLAPKTFKLRQ